MIVLKHLAREFDINPHKLRQVLRAFLGKTKGRWSWEDADPQLEKVRSHLKSYVENTSQSPKPAAGSSTITKPTHSPRASSSAHTTASKSSASPKSKNSRSI